MILIKSTCLTKQYGRNECLESECLLTSVLIQGNGPGDGSGSGNPGSDAATYITGGLLIPLAGLASLNLPTKGVPALTSLRPYAITVQNDVAAAQKAVENLKKSKPTSAGVSTAADVVEKAAKGKSTDDISTNFLEPPTRHDSADPIQI